MYTPIQLDKARNLKYGYRGLSLAEEALGMSINEIITKANIGTMTIKETFTMIWAGLFHEDNALTVEKVMDLVEEHSDLETVTEAMAKAIDASMPKGKSEKNSKKVASK